MPRPRKALVISSQPPGSNGVQALKYRKVHQHLLGEGWEVHYCGPDPALDAVITEAIPDLQPYVHYSQVVGRARVYSCRKHRHKRHGAAYLFYSALQAVALGGEKLFRSDPHSRQADSIRAMSTSLDKEHGFDLIAGIAPPFTMLELAYQIAGSLKKPYVALFDDPHGYRSTEGFQPADAERQAAVIAGSRAVVFASPLTREYYQRYGLVVESAPSYWISDCFTKAVLPKEAPAEADGEGAGLPALLRLVHLGNLGPWRPIGPFLEAVATYVRSGRQPPLHLGFYGSVYPEAEREVHGSSVLRRHVAIHPSVGYCASHRVAANADILVIAIGPRHRDNLPSKFFDYLPHRKPLLVIGPPGNPLQGLVEELQIGVYVDGQRAEAIYDAICRLAHPDEGYKRGYERSKEAIERFSSAAVAEGWAAILNDALGRDAAAVGAKATTV